LIVRNHQRARSAKLGLNLAELDKSETVTITIVIFQFDSQ
jgi:hypothetical protein